MSFYAGKPEWHESIYEVEIVDPVLGGTVNWRGDYPSSGYSNAAAQQLADRTVYLRNRVEEILGDIEEGVMARVEHQETASIEFIGDGRRGSPLRANLKESLDTIAWVRKDNTFTRDNFFRGVTEVENPTTARGAVNRRTLEAGLAPKADKTYVDTELDKKQNNLTAGANIQLDASTSVISATDTRYTAGAGLTLSGTTFSLPVTTSGTGTFVKSVTQNTNGITATLATPPDTTYNPATTTVDGLMSSADKTKLNGVATGATKNATDAQLRDRTTHTGVQPISTVTGLQDALDSKVDNTDSRLTNAREWTASVVTQAEAEAGTATTARKWTAQRVRQAILGWWNSSSAKTKLDGIATGATKNATDAQLRDRTTHTGEQPISTVTGLQAALDNKVNNDDARLTNSREWTASVVSQVEAEAGAATTARKWTAQRVRQAVLAWWTSTGNQTKLDGIATGATKNATDAQLRDRATHTGVQPISSVSGLQSALDGKVDNTDSRLTNSREWTGATVSQAEAEAGTATTRRAWTAQRVRQAIVAWWSTVGSAFGKTLLNSSDANAAKSSLGLHSVASSGNYNELSNRPASMTQTEANAGSSTTARLITPKVLVDTISNAVSGGVSADALIKANNLSDVPNKPVARNNLGLGTAATRNVGTSDGNLMEVGAFGWGVLGETPDGSYRTEVNYATPSITGINASQITVTGGTRAWRMAARMNSIAVQTLGDGGGDGTIYFLHHTGNLLQATGTSTTFPMSQKATTDALATKANTSTQVIAGNGLSGGGNFSANRTVALGTPSTLTSSTTNAVTASSHTHEIVVTKADVGLSNVTNVAQAAASTQVIAGNGLSGGGTLAANRTITLGTPSEISSSSTNSVAATSHTHALSAEVKASLAMADSALQVEDFMGANRDFSKNGFQKLPSGLIVQWGQADGVQPTGTIVTFPIAFPTQNILVIGSHRSANFAIARGSFSFYKRSLTQFDVAAYLSDSGAGSVFWFAIGY